MLRIIGVLAIAVLAFAGTLVATLAISGNLNRDALDRLMGDAPPTEAPAVKQDAIGPVARKLQEDRVALDKRAEQLDARESRIEGRERQLQQTLKEIEDLQRQIGTNLEAIDQEQRARMETLAKSIASMDKQKAAQTLEDQDPEAAAAILLLMKDKDRGKIMNELEPRRRTLIVQIMQEPRF